MNTFRESADVLQVLSRHPEDVQKRLFQLRDLVIETARTTKDVGFVEETLKWGQPSYVTVRPKSGTTVRIDRDTSGQGDVALFVSCNTSLVDDWRGLFPELCFGGSRSVHFPANQPLPDEALKHMVAMALTYHARKKLSKL